MGKDGHFSNHPVLSSIARDIGHNLIPYQISQIQSTYIVSEPAAVGEGPIVMGRLPVISLSRFPLSLTLASHGDSHVDQFGLVLESAFQNKKGVEYLAVHAM